MSKIQGKINSKINTNTQKTTQQKPCFTLVFTVMICMLYMQQTFGQGLPGEKKTCFYVHAADLWTRPARVKHATRPVQIHACSKPLGKACQGETKDNYIHIFFTCGKPLGKACQGSPCNTNTLAGKATCASCPFGKDTIHQCCFWC